MFRACRLIAGRYFTIRVNPVLLTVEPLVAVTVMLYVPVAVPEFAGRGGGGAGVLLPPPHEGTATTTATKTSRRITRIWCCRLLTSTMENNSPAPIIQVAKEGRCPCSCRSPVVGACVVIAMVAVVEPAVPVGFTDDGVIVHVASEGAPEQARLIVLPYPVEYWTAIEVCPDPPGAETITFGVLEVMEAKNPGVMVKNSNT